MFKTVPAQTRTGPLIQVARVKRSSTTTFCLIKSGPGCLNANNAVKPCQPIPVLLDFAVPN